MRALDRLALLGILWVTTSACGGRITADSSAPGAPAVSVDAGGSFEAGVDVDASAPATPPLPASILLENFQAAAPASENDAGQAELGPVQEVAMATFLLEPCVAPTNYGPCTYAETPCADSIRAGQEDSSQPAGALTVSGTLSGTTAVPQAHGLYWLVGGNSGLFAPGAALGVLATGDEVPPFAIHGIVGPPGVVLTTPTLRGMSFVFSAGQDVAFDWEGGQAGAEFLVTFATPGAVLRPEVACSFDASVGHATVPAVALAALGTAGTTLNVHWGQFTSTTFTVGRWVGSLTAGSGAAALASFQ